MLLYLFCMLDGWRWQHGFLIVRLPEANGEALRVENTCADFFGSLLDRKPLSWSLFSLVFSSRAFNSVAFKSQRRGRSTLAARVPAESATHRFHAERFLGAVAAARLDCEGVLLHRWRIGRAN